MLLEAAPRPWRRRVGAQRAGGGRDARGCGPARASSPSLKRAGSTVQRAPAARAGVHRERAQQRAPRRARRRARRARARRARRRAAPGRPCGAARRRRRRRRPSRPARAGARGPSRRPQPIGERVDGEVRVGRPEAVDGLELEHLHRRARGQVRREPRPAGGGEGAGVDHAELGGRHHPTERPASALIHAIRGTRARARGTPARPSGTSRGPTARRPRGGVTSAPSALQLLARCSTECSVPKRQSRVEGDEQEARVRRALGRVGERLVVVHHPRQVEVGVRVEAGEEDRRPGGRGSARPRSPTSASCPPPAPAARGRTCAAATRRRRR